MTSATADRIERFRRLHERAGAFLLPNPWDVGTARVLAGRSFTVPELAAAGVRRVSLGSSLAWAALGAFLGAAREVKEQGTFGFAAGASPFAELDPFMSDGAG